MMRTRKQISEDVYLESIRSRYGSDALMLYLVGIRLLWLCVWIVRETKRAGRSSPYVEDEELGFWPIARRKLEDLEVADG